MFGMQQNDLGRHQAFLKRHGEPVRHPQRKRLWIFPNGAQYLEPPDRGVEGQYQDPSLDPAHRLGAVLEYLNAKYAEALQAFERAEQLKNIEALRHLAAGIKVLRNKIEQTLRDYHSLPTVREELEQARAELERQMRLRDLQRQQELRVEEEIRQIAAEVRDPGEPPRLITPAELAALGPTLGIERLNSILNDDVEEDTVPRKPRRSASTSRKERVNA